VSAEGVDEEKTCLMDSICKNKDKEGANKNSPCHKIHAPYDNVTDNDFYDLLWNNCPHFFDDKGELVHKLCCSAEQEDSISRLINQVDIIRRSCPSCTMNAKKYFCNLFCLPNQNQMVNVEKTAHKAVLNVSYIVSKKFAQTFFESCYDVKIFGAYLMDQDFICGSHKRDKCDANKFLTTLGSISQMPLIIRPVITDTALVTIMGHNYTPMSGEAYQCYEAPPHENKCSCDNCQQRCNETLLKNIETKFKHLDDKNSAFNSMFNRFSIIHIFVIAFIVRYLF